MSTIPQFDGLEGDLPPLAPAASSFLTPQRTGMPPPSPASRSRSGRSSALAADRGMASQATDRLPAPPRVAASPAPRPPRALSAPPTPSSRSTSTPGTSGTQVPQGQKKSVKKKKLGTRTVMKPMAHVRDAKKFIEMVAKKRGIPEERMMARISMDHGRGSFKVVISIFDRDAMSDNLAPGECKGRLFTGVYSTL